MARKRPLQEVGRAGQAVQGTAAQANRTLAEIRQFVEELKNGFTIYAIRSPGNDNTIMDFVMGRCDELPVAFKVEPKER